MDGTQVVKRAIAAAAVASALLAAGCGGSADPSGDPTGSGPSPTASGSSTSPSTDESTSTTPTATPTATPATGPLLEMPDVSVRAPAGWKLQKQVVDFSIDAKAPGSITGVQLSDQSALGEASLQKLARVTVQSYGESGSVRAVDTVTIDGVESYHVTGNTSRFDQVDDYGAIRDGAQVNLHFLFEKKDFTPAERQDIIDSVLASWSWG